MNEMHDDAGVCVAIGHERGDAAFLRAAGWLGFAAMPTFALMALLSGVVAGDPICSAAHGASPLSGMALMYMLMSAFHSAPWLKWVARRHSNRGH